MLGGVIMTAEVAILNKSAVVLAADSAVTISRGSSQEKTFDSADKLFELSNHNHIAIMVNGDLQFMDAPLSVLIKDFRDTCSEGQNVEEVANRFLAYLSNFGARSPKSLADDSTRETVNQIFKIVSERVENTFREKLEKPEFLAELKGGDELRNAIVGLRRDLYRRQIEVVRAWLSYFPDASFIGSGPLKIKKGDERIISELIDANSPNIGPENVEGLLEIGRLALSKAGFSASETGVIIAGYGKNELFPTLLSFSIYGTVSGRLKYQAKEKVDIDREGHRARVVAFAQREMVERFIYGLDDQIERKIAAFSREGIAAIREALFEHLEIDGDGLERLKAATEQAEQAFLDGLSERGFQAIRTSSEAEIEGMVEFMPKIEMARMAEALVNLTSIKRRVSRGMETVGGPIDVAVISKSEGLVWVKRKHYFPPELNATFFDRKRQIFKVERTSDA